MLVLMPVMAPGANPKKKETTKKIRRPPFPALSPFHLPLPVEVITPASLEPERSCARASGKFSSVPYII